MAKQNGIIKLKGTIDDISFYKSADGHLARAKGGVDANRIANDPAFQRTRENGQEFGRAGKGGKLLRKSIRILLQQASDRRVVSRLTRDLLAIVKTDPVNERGQRTIQDGDLTLLNGFECNLNGKLATTFFSEYSLAFDRATGEATLNVPAFSPSLRIAAPGGTTHFMLSLGAAELDFANETAVFNMDSTGVLPYTGADTAQLSLAASVTANSTLPVIQVLGVSFFQEVNGQMYALKNGANNALAIVNVDAS
jgi:hypothetical protein